MNKFKNKNNKLLIENLDLIQSYLVAIDNKNKDKIEILFNENEKNTIKNDIVLWMYFNDKLNSERLKFIIENFRNYLNVSSILINELIKTNNNVLLETILRYNIKFFDNEIIINLLFCYKNKTPISDYKLNDYLDMDKYKVPLKSNDENIDSHNSSFYLFNACKIGNEGMVKYLIEHGVNKTIKDKIGRSILFLACESGNKHLVKYLVNLGIDVNTQCNKGSTALFNACNKGHEKVVKYLVNEGADISKQADDGTTPIFKACSSANEQLVRYLVEEGVDIGKEANDGTTPIFYACSSGNE